MGQAQSVCDDGQVSESTVSTFKEGNWYHEKLEPGLTISYEVSQVFHKGKSEFQEVEVVETGAFGRCLITDRLMQSSLKDEAIYHESLVQPAMTAHPDPKKVFIGGGGEGATLREVLRHKGVEECVMVDIDGDVVNMCKEHTPTYSAGAYDDPRTKLVIDDAKGRLEGFSDGYFDVIVLDLSDPLDGGPCYQLYTTAFYKTCLSKLNEGGILVTQSGCAGSLDCKCCFTAVHNTLKQVFPKVWGYTAHVPSFMSEWGFNIAYKTAGTDFVALASEIDARLAQKGVADQMKWYDSTTHQRMFSLGKFVRTALAEEERILTVENPIFMTEVTAGINK
ncbi:hypothetical protein CYMTET_26669 [Cymbomonas tetramitiformis]|uniref:thermospermine synthase n=1 Tax=Cymbomonas tetramitiformis TaxID=36881 RepID=A0AAE0FRA2_9CHLO|nr:hypothetical protein CYMTET_26669 [Cymbomonas tetramitiformis]|eukprot:gene24171-29343_t